MPLEFIRNILEECRERFESALGARGVLQEGAKLLGQALGASRAVIYYLAPTDLIIGDWRESSEDRASLTPLFEMKELQSGSLTIQPLFLHDIKRSALPQPLLDKLTSLSVQSVGIIPITERKRQVGWIELHFTSQYHRWRKEESAAITLISDYIALYTGIRLSSKAPTKLDLSNLGAPDEAELRYRRLAEYGNLIIVRTDPKFHVLEIIGNADKILGSTAADLVSGPDIWSKILHPADYRRLSLKLARAKTTHFTINEEIRVLNRTTGQERWLLLKGVPLLSANKEFIGWEGFGLDITEKRQAEEELIAERRRIEALYEVARSLQANMDPAVVTLRGVKTLLRATNSDAGFGCLYDAQSGRLEIVAAEGVSGDFVQKATEHLETRGLVRLAVEEKRGFLIEDIQQDPRAAKELVASEGLRATIIVPFMFEESVLGAVVLYCKRVGRYSQADFELVSAASSQIGLAARQAEAYAAEKRQASSLAALYQLTHEVSKYLTPHEVAEHAFPILQQELACKRMWLGVLNEQGTHIVGQGGYGPGMRGGILSVQVELELRHDFFDEAIRTRQPVIVEANAPMECSGLTRIMEKLKPGIFVIVPLVSVGKVVGVIAAEPSVPSAFFAQKRLALLTSMANEIATVILARRFEGRMAEGNKMRMAALLASGVAHNFNNLLQAVMGQASLIEMQLPKDSPMVGSARMILAAAEKGATLIRQLLSFSAESGRNPRVFSLNEMLRESKDIYRSVLGAEIQLDMKLAADAPLIKGDYSQLQQAITSLLVNAKEAIGGKPNGSVKIATAKVRLRSGEIDPELPPGAYLRIDVEDNGPGMDPEKLSRCFEPFFTTKGADTSTGLGFGSAGLGLSTSYAILKHHEGLITVSSQVGEGATFSIYLPARENEREAVAETRYSLRPEVTVEARNFGATSQNQPTNGSSETLTPPSSGNRGSDPTKG